MAQVLVLVERNATDGSVRRSTCALLTVARRLGTPVAVLCGPSDHRALGILGRYGAERICLAERTAAGAFPATAKADVLVNLAKRESPAAILITSGYAGQEIAARVAVRLDSGIITDAVEVRPGDEGPTALQKCLAGSYLVESAVVRGTAVITVRPEAAKPEPAPVDPVVEPVDVEFSEPASAMRLVSSEAKDDATHPVLGMADVIVAGGRGLGSHDAFGLIKRLAEALGGAAAGSHTAAELGWCPRELEIGLPGTTVHPRLYLANGISGSVRHRAGMQGSKTIVAIDDDPAAPIFRIADFGVVGDVHEVLPALLAEITRRKAQGSHGSIGTHDLAEA
jgi:electron transfer flavoprotein alpha subunit